MMNLPIREFQIKERARNGNYILSLICVVCKRPKEITVSGHEMFKLQTSNLSLQAILPNHTPGEREMFISGICDTCWEEIFKKEDDEVESNHPQGCVCADCSGADLTAEND